jgi:hypothetical protein
VLAIARVNKLITIPGNSSTLHQAALSEEDIKLLEEEAEKA